MIKRPPEILVINSDVIELKKVETFLTEIFREYNLEMKYFNRVYLCISEAVINSIKHGNKNDKNKSVSIEVSYEEPEIRIRVEDEGNGFDLNQITDPTSEKNLKNESGRGIFIIKTLTNQIEYNEKGNRIQFKYRM
ncbi:MAG: anti-sigma regulatory [Prolixibacteraceae bacterium]|nr:MAG: anti-sigma regulatory [Prolixibacteraceae bacterium]